jgi:hypothetical protein
VQNRPILAATDPAPLVVANRTSHVHAAIVLLDSNLALWTAVGFARGANHVPFNYVACILLTNSSWMPLLLTILAVLLIAIDALGHQFCKIDAPVLEHTFAIFLHVQFAFAVNCRARNQIARAADNP